jgi:beta-glucosidase
LQELLKRETCSVSFILGRPLVLVQENETVPAILNTWFAGSEAGRPLQMSCLVMKILLVN